MPIILTILLLAALVALVLLMPSKGAIGEKRVARMLEKQLPDDYVVMNDITVPSDFGTTQIDHIVFSTCGIFIIETKNYKGWITGSDRSEYWQKNMYGYKYQFRNPTRQNYAHFKALQSLLGFSDYCFHPIVVFANSAWLRLTTRNDVVNNAHLIDTILKYQNVVLTAEDIQSAIHKVQSVALVEKGTKKQHVHNVRANINDRNNKIRSGICPRCGGTLVERNGKYGRFYGCSNYPACKFTLKH